jgi:hypothetical protein
MRLSKPLLDNYRRHPTIDRYCTEDDTHHAEGLRRLLPRADWIALEQISRSTCARRSELLAMNSRRLESPGSALKPLNDDAYLRVILLEMASVTGEATVRDSNASSSIEAAQELEGDRTAVIDSKDVKAPVVRRLKTKNTKQVDIVFSKPQNLSRPQLPTTTGTERYPGHLDRRTQVSNTQTAVKTNTVGSNSSDVTVVSETLTACTRCRTVGLSKPRGR